MVRLHSRSEEDAHLDRLCGDVLLASIESDILPSLECHCTRSECLGHACQSDNYPLPSEFESTPSRSILSKSLDHARSSSDIHWNII